MHAHALERVSIAPFPWRTVGLLAVIALLAAALVVTTIGSAPQRPAPFGLAANGLIAYVDEGSIYTLDPLTGDRVGLATGPAHARDPRWSLDGTRLAFIREVAGDTEEIVIVDTVGGRPRLVISGPLKTVDSDGIEWAPDGRSLLVSNSLSPSQIALMDTADGTITILPIPEYVFLEAFYRPPYGREVVFLSGTEASRTISIVSLVDLHVREVPLAPDATGSLRPMGWTPDGARLLVNRASPDDGLSRTYVVDPDTGVSTELDVAYGHVSNDGRWVAGLTVGDEDTTCVVSIDGGPCRIVGDRTTAAYGTHGKGLQWSPDDEWLIVGPAGGPDTVLLDPDGSGDRPPDHLPNGIGSWQRRAP